MKKSIVFALTTTLLLVSGCDSKTIDQQGANVFPYSEVDGSLAVTMGDVMPFYDNGVMNIYHLKNITGSNSLFYHPISRLTTSDYIHYQNKGVALDYEEDIKSVDAALGTGSFIKDKNGVFHCFYTGHNDKAMDEGLPHVEVIRHATSIDNQETWQKDEEFLLYGYENDFRDPYVYYDNIDECYYMLITSRDYGNAVIRRYYTSNLNAKANEWEFKDNFFTNDEGSYNMECPSFIQFGNFYYLAYSEQGDNRVTHYRYKDRHDGEWKKFERDAIDAAGFYAGRLEKAGDKLFAFAWCARLTGGNTGEFDWAGNLVTHQLEQKENGELCAVIPYTYKDYFKNEVEYPDNESNNITNYDFDGSGIKATALNKLSENVTRMSFKMTAKEAKGDFGLTFGLSNQYNNRLGDGLLAFNLKENKLVCYNNVSSVLRYGEELTSVSYSFELNKDYAVDVIVDGEVVSVYLNNEIALTARLIDMENNYFAFYSNNAKAEIKGVEFYE